LTKEAFQEKLLSFVQKFEKDKHHYLSKNYLEAQVRQDFIDPLFEALGWDIENKKGLSPFDREVILEKGETSGRPDYNFRIDGTTKFFVEAKAPSVALDNVNHILQAKTYAWSTKEVYFVLLTDFEEFKLFDASLKPNPKFPNEGLIFDFKYTDYLKNIDKLYQLSKEEVEKGSLERLLPKDVKSKRLRIPVDRAFLEDMTQWREGLAKDIYKRNSDMEQADHVGVKTDGNMVASVQKLDVNLLNDVVQKLLDRIIFIRIAEDRKIRDPRELQEIVEVWRHEGRRKPLLTHLKDLFYEVNADLNGDIFKPHACETIDVDSNLLAEIIENLYFPKCRYRFDVIGVELLGSIYERYLGSTIRVTPQRVKVEEKPEVRKAGGVYYTPKYIVDYIVKNTVGKLIEGKTPKQIEKIKILDPACGSGSFLLGAYQYLLDYHLEYYRKHPKEAQTITFDFYQKVRPDDLSLPLRAKARILKNNIFGVDIDPQAVEITMMSLYLKALEGERSLLPKKQALLPSLTYNIKCGNSLIGYDFFEQGNLFKNVGEGLVPSRRETTRVSPTTPDELKSRINPFDWNSKTAGFGEIMENGGFDCVIGNPPYGAEFSQAVLDYLKNNFTTSIWRGESYLLFIEQGLRVLKVGGLLGFITPDTYLNLRFTQSLRTLLLKNSRMKEIVSLPSKVFSGATVDTTLLFTEKASSAKIFHKTDVRIRYFSKKAIISTLDEAEQEFYLSTKIWHEQNAFNISSNNAENLIISRIDSQCKQVASFAEMFSGVKVYEVGKGDSPQTEKIRDTKPFTSSTKENKDFQPFFDGKHIGRYTLLWRENNWLNYGPWLAAPRNPENFIGEKILIRKIIGQTLIATYIPKTSYCNTLLHVLKIKPENHMSYSYLLGILNSRFIGWYFRKKFQISAEDTFPQIMIRDILQLPVPKTDKGQHDKLVSLVDRMLDLHKKKNTLPPSSEREKVEREIAVMDEKIDEIVYGLYEITEGERKVIEGK